MLLRGKAQYCLYLNQDAAAQPGLPAQVNSCR